MDFVSVCVITYNQEKYIVKAIDSILAQVSNYSFEIIIGDDCSTDKTTEILRTYQHTFPGKVNLILHDKNVGATQNLKDVLYAAKGKYIALLEGDDYWTDKTKLNKQVDFLEANPAYTICSHAYHVVNEHGEIIQNPVADLEQNFPDGFDITMDSFFNRWLTKTLTTVYRNDATGSVLSDYKILSDGIIFFNILLKGKCRWMNFNGGCYTSHSDGTWSAMKVKGQLLFAYNRYHDLFQLNKNVASLRIALLEKIKQIIDYNIHPDNRTEINYHELICQSIEYYRVSEDKMQARKYLKNEVLNVLILRLKIRIRKLVDKDYRSKYNNTAK